MKQKSRKYIKSLYHTIIFLFKINIIKTLFLNFKTQKFKNALRLPIFVYGKLNIYSLKGRLIIDAPIKRGMIKIGQDVDHNPVSLLPIKFTIKGDFIFKGSAIISGGSTITIWRGKITLGRNVCICSGVQLKASDEIKIGDYTRITALCTIMDTNVHLMKNIETGEIKKIFAPIKIGSHCWLNSGTIVTKGTIIPNYSISARNTFFNKDYSKTTSPNSVFAGTPAKVIATNQQRIFNVNKENEVKEYFYKNIEKNIYYDEKGLYSEPFDIGGIF